MFMASKCLKRESAVSSQVPANCLSVPSTKYLAGLTAVFAAQGARAGPRGLTVQKP